MNEKIFEQQQTFQKLISSTEYKDLNRVDRLKDCALGIQKNVYDIVNTLDWDKSKEHKANSSLHQKVEAVDAAIDIIKYAMNVPIEFDVSYDELVQLIQMKNRTVEQKFKQRQFLNSDKFKNSHYAFIIDIDGVIADIVKAYKNWFCSQTAVVFNHFSDLENWKIKNIDTYKELKEKYRLSGYKMVMPAVDNARDLLRICHEKGIVSLLSNRPIKTYPIIYMYTVEWLYNRGMAQWVDMIHFTDLGEKRYFFDRFNRKEVYFIEDNEYNIINTDERPNVCNIFVRNETNENNIINFDKADKIKFVRNLSEAIAFIKEMTNDEENNDCSEDIRD